MPEVPSSEGWRATAPVFAALGDPTRLDLVARLCGGQALSISQLASGADITRQAITKHLHVLEEVGLVRGAKRGREQLWELAPEQLAEARRCLEQIGRQWENALDRLKEFAENA